MALAEPTFSLHSRSRRASHSPIMVKFTRSRAPSPKSATMPPSSSIQAAFQTLSINQGLGIYDPINPVEYDNTTGPRKIRRETELHTEHRAYLDHTKRSTTSQKRRAKSFESKNCGTRFVTKRELEAELVQKYDVLRGTTLLKKKPPKRNTKKVTFLEKDEDMQARDIMQDDDDFNAQFPPSRTPRTPLGSRPNVFVDSALANSMQTMHIHHGPLCQEAADVYGCEALRSGAAKPRDRKTRSRLRRAMRERRIMEESGAEEGRMVVKNEGEDGVYHKEMDEDMVVEE